MLPTTPLSCWPPGASPLVARFHRKLYRSWFGGYLRHWQKPGHAARAKPRAIAFILITFAVSLWLVKMMWVRILLLAILVCLLIFVADPVVDEKQQSTEASSWRLQLWRTASDSTVFDTGAPGQRLNNIT
ncbi:MAG: hypothetical protein ACLTXH_08930 [Enterobacter hormaechei]